MFSTWLVEYLGLRPTFTSAVQMGGATPHSNMALAAALVESGRCRAVMVADGDNRASKFSRQDKVQAMSSQVGHLSSLEPPHEFDGPYGPTAPALYGMMATRHMYEYGSTPEQFARIAVAFRAHGALNERAQLRKPVTVEDVLASPIIAWPLHRDECALISDWGSAILVTTPEYASDAPARPRLPARPRAGAPGLQSVPGALDHVISHQRVRGRGVRSRRASAATRSTCWSCTTRSPARRW